MLVFLAFMGVTFLNMSFVLMEVTALKHAYDKEDLANIAMLLSFSMAEEEQDPHESPENQSIKIIDILSEYTGHLQLEDSGISLILKTRGKHFETHPGFDTIFTPPPNFC